MRLLQSVSAHDGVPSQGQAAMAFFLPVAVVACCLTTGCARPDYDKFKDPSPVEALAMRNGPPDPVTESRSRGRELYEHYCSICHGKEGSGDGLNSTNLSVSPRDFSSREFWRQATDDRLLLVVSRGGRAVDKSVLMPAWGRTLTDHQLRDVVAFLHTLVARAEPKDADSDSPVGSQ